jgi:hypothetical protein
LRLHFCQNIIPSFGIVFVFVFVLCPAQARKRTVFHLVGFDELTLWCGVWCGVVWCDVSQDGVLIEVKSMIAFSLKRAGLTSRKALV